MFGRKIGFHGQVFPHFPRDFACFSIPKIKKRDHTLLRFEPRTHVISRCKTFIRPGEFSSHALGKRQIQVGKFLK